MSVETGIERHALLALSARIAHSTQHPHPQPPTPPSSMASSHNQRESAKAPVLQPHRLVEVLPDGSVRFSGRSRHGAGFDVGVARTSLPWTPTSKYNYFEVTIVACSTTSYTSLGLVSQPFQFVSHPGTDEDSVGLHGQDGRKWIGGISTSCAQKFKQGDTVGCGIDWDKRNVWFTINGRNLGIAFKNFNPTCSAFYPAVGLHDPQEFVSINLDESKSPFKFDLAAFIQSERVKLLSEIDSVPLPSPEMHAIIQEYLLHSGYAETLRAFQPGANSKKAFTGPLIPNQTLLEMTIDFRSELQSEILNGNALYARTKVVERYPTLLIQPSLLSRLLDLLFKCQHFIDVCRTRIPLHLHTPDSEFINNDPPIHSFTSKKRKTMDSEQPPAPQLKRAKYEIPPESIDDIITTMLREELGPLVTQYTDDKNSIDSEFRSTAITLLEKTASLAAYENPFESPNAYLLSPSHRHLLAETLNTAILNVTLPAHPTPHLSTLSKLLHQLVHTRTEARTGYTPSSLSSSTSRKPRDTRRRGVEPEYSSLLYNDYRPRRNAITMFGALEDEFAAGSGGYADLFGTELLSEADRRMNNSVEEGREEREEREERRRRRRDGRERGVVVEALPLDSIVADI